MAAAECSCSRLRARKKCYERSETGLSAPSSGICTPVGRRHPRRLRVCAEHLCQAELSQPQRHGLPATPECVRAYPPVTVPLPLATPTPPGVRPPFPAPWQPARLTAPSVRSLPHLEAETSVRRCGEPTVRGREIEGHLRKRRGGGARGACGLPAAGCTVRRGASPTASREAVGWGRWGLRCRGMR
eukprot:195267-Chlamydomonas_euryale.AAC.4